MPIGFLTTAERDGLNRFPEQIPDDDLFASVRAGDVLEARGVQDFSAAHRRQDGGPPARQPRRPHPRWTEEEDVVVTTPT